VRGLWLVIIAGVLIGLWVALWPRFGRRRRHRLEVQKLLALAAKDGTLTPAMLQASMGLSKEDAEGQLVELRKEGLAEFDVDEEGKPRYRVDPNAIEARKNKGW
jgi:hypothetical protein